MGAYGRPVEVEEQLLRDSRLDQVRIGDMAVGQNPVTLRLTTENEQWLWVSRF